MCTTTCVWHPICAFTWAAWNLYFVMHIPSALFIDCPNSPAHPVPMCTMKCYRHRFTCAQWNLHNEMHPLQLGTCTMKSACQNELHHLSSSHWQINMCTMTCVWHPPAHSHVDYGIIMSWQTSRLHCSSLLQVHMSTRLTCAPRNVAETNMHVHHEICTMRRLWHWIARAQWNQYASTNFIYLFVALRDSHVHHDMCLTSHLRIHICTMIFLCCKNFAICIIHGCSQFHMCTKFTCAPWNVADADSHVHHEICTMRWSGHTLARAPWHLYVLTIFVCLSSSYWHIHMCTITCVWHRICTFTCAPWSFMSQQTLHLHCSQPFLIHVCTTLTCAPWKASDTCSYVHNESCIMTSFWHSFARAPGHRCALWQFHLCTMTQVWHRICAFTCAPWNLCVLIVFANAFFIPAPDSHVHPELLPTYIHICTTISVCNNELCMFLFIAIATSHMQHEILLTHVHLPCSLPHWFMKSVWCNELTFISFTDSPVHQSVRLTARLRIHIRTMKVFYYHRRCLRIFIAAPDWHCYLACARAVFKSVTTKPAGPTTFAELRFGRWCNRTGWGSLRSAQTRPFTSSALTGCACAELVERARSAS